MSSDLSALEEQLLSTDFDVDKHASEILQQTSLNVNQYIKDLTTADEELDRKLQDQVSSHYEDLLSQATGIEKLESHLSMMQAHMNSLNASTDRLKARIHEPYEKIRIQTVTLARLQQTCDLLRRIIRVRQLGKKLQSQLHGGQTEITKAAQSLSELSELWTPDLDGIEVIEQDERIILHAKTEIERHADGMLTRGMEAQNQTQIGTALQVFYNLGTLDNTLDQVFQDQVKKIKKQISDALNVKKITASVEGSSSRSKGGTGGSGAGPGRAGSLPGPGNMSAFRATLWTNIEALLDAVFTKTCEIIHLQRILCKKRDNVTHVSFIEIVRTSRQSLVEVFWNEATALLQAEFLRSSELSNFMKQALEGEYPKLLRMYKDLWSRLCGAAATYSLLPTEKPESVRNPFVNSQTMDASLRETLAPFERAYLSRSLSRLFDPVNLMFSAGDPPSQEEIDQVFRTISSELNIAQVESNLLFTVSKNIAKTVKLICVKCGQILVTDGEASQVIGYPTEGQLRNVQVVNFLASFKTGIENLLATTATTPEAKQVIVESLENVRNQNHAAINPLMNSIQDAIEAIILTLHNEDFSGEETEDESKACSLYMKELQAFISRVSRDFLSRFSCTDLIADDVKPLIANGIDLFVIHASLIRPLGRAGQLRLASDCAQLELALEPLSLADVKQTKDYQTLRAFRSMLFMQPEDIPNCPTLGDALPFSIALHFLFSKAPPELKSPHESAGWSISRYSNWLEDHPSERDRLQLIQGALESYVAGTRQRGEKSYAHPYPIMLPLLQKALSTS